MVVATSRSCALASFPLGQQLIGVDHSCLFFSFRRLGIASVLQDFALWRSDPLSFVCVLLLFLIVCILVMQKSSVCLLCLYPLDVILCVNKIDLHRKKKSERERYWIGCKLGTQVPGGNVGTWKPPSSWW